MTLTPTPFTDELFVTYAILAILSSASRSAIALMVLPPNVAFASTSTLNLPTERLVALNVATSETVRFLNYAVSAVTLEDLALTMPSIPLTLLSRSRSFDIKASQPEILTLVPESETTPSSGDVIAGN